MENKRILLTAFRSTSAELLIREWTEYKILILPNNKVKDSEKLIDALSKEHFDYVVSFGQRPNIKNKVHVEATAKDGEMSLDTVFDCEMLRLVFEQNGIPAMISHNAGTSYCNRLYWNGLKYIAENCLKTEMVFVHVPFVKNIGEFKVFQERIINAVTAFQQN